MSGFSDNIMETVIGKDTKFVGNIEANGTIRVDGLVEGEIVTKGELIVGESGKVKAKVKAKGAIIAGTINGNAEIINKLELASTGKIYGDIKTTTLIIGEGAVFRGACEMQHSNEEQIKQKNTTEASAKS
ncbi:MAG: hypothetical protein H6Q74_2075 [Firmicutes bacterium]|nr:hypothetical protein [Bacillota bacterium]